MHALRQCTVPGCKNAYHGGGFCKIHLNHFQRYGDPLANGTHRGRPLGARQQPVFTDRREVILPATCPHCGSGSRRELWAEHRVNGEIVCFMCGAVIR